MSSTKQIYAAIEGVLKDEELRKRWWWVLELLTRKDIKVIIQPWESDELHGSDVIYGCISMHESSVHLLFWFLTQNEHLCLSAGCFIKWLPQLPLPLPLSSCSSPLCTLWACAPSLSATDEGRWPELVGGWDGVFILHALSFLSAIKEYGLLKCTSLTGIRDFLVTID